MSLVRYVNQFDGLDNGDEDDGVRDNGMINFDRPGDDYAV